MVTELQQWLEAYDTWLWAASIASAFLFVGSLVIVPWMVVRMPADYFLDEDDPRRQSRPAKATARAEARFALRLLKNALGAVLLTAGVAMLLLPGQGFLTLLVGISLVDFPRKKELERAMVRRPHILNALNWMRGKAHQPPLIVDDIT